MCCAHRSSNVVSLEIETKYNTAGEVGKLWGKRLGAFALGSVAYNAADTFTDTSNKERESLQKMSDISAEQLKCLNESSKNSIELVSELGETIKEHANNVKPDLATGQTPAKRTIELPKSGFLQ